MTQKVLKVGSSAAVTIPKEYLGKLGLKPGDEVIVELDGKKLKFSVHPSKTASLRRQRIAELTYNFINRYRSDLEALAKK